MLSHRHSAIAHLAVGLMGMMLVDTEGPDRHQQELIDEHKEKQSPKQIPYNEDLEKIRADNRERKRLNFEKQKKAR